MLLNYVEETLFGKIIDYKPEYMRINNCINIILLNIIARHRYYMMYDVNGCTTIYNIFEKIKYIIESHDMEQNMKFVLEEIFEEYIKI